MTTTTITTTTKTKSALELIELSVLQAAEVIRREVSALPASAERAATLQYCATTTLWIEHTFAVTTERLENAAHAAKWSARHAKVSANAAANRKRVERERQLPPEDRADSADQFADNAEWMKRGGAV